MSVFLDSDLPPETLARARAGAVDAQEAIYRAYQRPVRTLARRWLESASEGGGGEWPEQRSVSVTGDTVDLERALARLGDTARAVVWLHDVEGYTHAQIGQLLGGTASFSKSQLARAHLRLRELLESDGVKATCMPISNSY